MGSRSRLRSAELRPPVVDSRCAGDGSVDGHPGQHHRQHRSPHRAARPALLQRRPPMDRYRLLAGLRQPAPLGGRIGDMVGRKRALIIGLVGFALASAIGGASVDFAMLVVARTVQGAFGALLAPSVLALLTTTFADPDQHRPGLRGLRRYSRGRRDARTAPRRHPDLLRVLAMDAIRQPRLRCLAP